MIIYTCVLVHTMYFSLNLPPASQLVHVLRYKGTAEHDWSSNEQDNNYSIKLRGSHCKNDKQIYTRRVLIENLN